ncbi:MAG: hypothetical protein Q8R70_00120 [Methanoregula sp.]|nr:hypothetical protein [Methanoregula sp.]
MHIRSLHLLHNTFPTLDAYPFNLEIFLKTGSIDLFQPVTFFFSGRTGPENQHCSGRSPAAVISTSGKSARESGTP